MTLVPADGVQGTDRPTTKIKCGSTTGKAEATVGNI